jgi:invasion protein IalB
VSMRAKASTRFACAIALIASTMLAETDAFAQTDAAPAAQPAESWATSCSASGRGDALDCAIEQRVIEGRTRQFLASMRIRIPSDTRAPVMLVQTPLGIYLPGKLVLSVDGKDVSALDFQSCNQNGCYAGAPVPAELLAGMVQGEKLSLTFQSGNRQPVAVPISLIGFAKAYDRIK